MKWRGLFVVLAAVFVLGGCSQQKAEPVRVGTIADGDLNPANWGKVYPLEYDSWTKTKDPRPVVKTK
jgi:nitrite reductase (cytochrome c-552)